MRTASQLPRPESRLVSIVWLLVGIGVSGWLLWHAAPNSVPSKSRAAAQLGNPALYTGTSAKARPSTLRIEEIRKGDLVLAHDPDTGKQEYKRVSRVYRRVSDHLRVLRISHGDDDDEELKTTDEHPFWVVGRGWVPAAELSAGDQLRQEDGRTAQVTSSRYERHVAGVPVFNIETEDFHTYFVLAESGDAPAMLVHNCGGATRKKVVDEAKKVLSEPKRPPVKTPPKTPTPQPPPKPTPPKTTPGKQPPAPKQTPGSKKTSSSTQPLSSTQPRAPSRSADPKAAPNALRSFRSKNFHINGQNVKLDKSGMKHILERHHPKFWNGTTKAKQSFFPKNMSPSQIQDAVGEVLKQNRGRVGEIGSNGVGQMTGTVNGVKYQLGLNRGRVGQFFPLQ